MDFAIIRLIFAALVPVIFAIIFTLLTKRDNSFAKMSKSARQIIIGIVFGGIAILGTEFGIPVQGVQLNVRDAAPMVAGLVFGGPAGIIAGIIGGVERWLSVYWGMGTFTRFACSFSTVMAGFLAAAIRRFMTYNKKPDVGLALGSGAVMEVFHLSMIFFTNIKDETQAIEVVRVCFWPMVIANGLSVMNAVIAAKAVEGELKGIIRARREKEQRRIFKILRKWIVLAIGGAFLVAMWFSLSMQSNLAIKETRDRINVVISEVSEDVSDASDRHLLELGRLVTREIEIYEYDLDEMAKRYNLTDISIVDKNGIIIDSNNPSYIGYDMAAGEQSAEFLCLLNGEQEYVQAYGPIAMDSNICRKYAGVAMQEGFIQVSYDAEAFQKDVDRQLENVVENRRIGENGGIIIIDANLATISKSESLSSLSFKNSKNVNVKPDGEIRSYDINGTSYYVSVRTVEGYYIVALYPVHDALQQRDISLYVVFFNMVLIFAFLYVLLFFLVRRVIVSKIEKVASSLDKISAGNLDTVVDVRGSEEFVSLSGNINQTVDTLKRYIAEAAARIDAELEFAKTIQESSLPKDFPETDEFSIYATMDTAKEVGGDFYDYYISDDGKLNFVIADVSGKGIPAAMFMMRSKSILRSLTEQGKEVDEVFCEGNKSLVAGNDASMFVTAWQGALDLSTGLVKYANAGHNYPIVKRGSGKFELIKEKVNFVLGGIARSKYVIHELQLEPGDIIFQYTDGANEAINEQEEMYGLERMIDVLNAKEYDSLKEMCDAVMEEIRKFVGDADQFDDITMLAMKWKAPKK